jgi:hypothetical protein
MVLSKRPTTDAARNAVRRERALLAARAHHRLHVDGRVVARGVDQDVVAEDADEAPLEVHDGQARHAFALEDLGDVLAVGGDGDPRGSLEHQLLQACRRIGDGEVADADRADEELGGVDEVDAGNVHGAEVAQAPQRLGGRGARAQRQHPRVHQRSRRAGRVGGDLPKIAREAGREPVEQLLARRGLEPRGEAGGLGRVEGGDGGGGGLGRHRGQDAHGGVG